IGSPGRYNSWAMVSASIRCAPNSENILPTVDLPQDIPPVRPTRSMALSHASTIGIQAQPVRFNRVFHEHGDGERSYTSGYRSQRSCHLIDTGMNITDQGEPFLLEGLFADRVSGEELPEYLLVSYAVHPHVNHRCSWLYELVRYQARLPNGRDEDVRLTANFSQVARLGMANGDGGIMVQQQQSHGLADHKASSDYHRAAACYWNVASEQDLHYSGWSAGHQGRTPCYQISHVDRMEAVHILLRRDRQQDLLGIHLWRQRQLHKDAVNIVTAVPLCDCCQQLCRSHGSGWSNLFAVYANFLTGSYFVANVDLGGRMISGDDDGQTRPASGC